MTAAEYRAAKGVNFSTLKLILRSPWTYFKAITGGGEREETIDMLLGTMGHGYWLEGKKPEYVIKPEGMSFASKDGKKWRAEQTLPILTAEEAKRLYAMVEALANDPTAVMALEARPMRERPIFFTYRGIACKALLDSCGQVCGKWSIMDLKKTPDARPAAWGKKAIEYDYCFQAAFYRAALASAEGLDYAPDFIWQVIEDSDAPQVVHYPLTDTGAEIGQARMDAAFDLLIACQETGKWPGYGRYLQPEWPAWALKQ